ncbi:hypothetical protein STAS_26933 [Striga asiatica]|uniref:Uncharacterized protein n=1 Tax=Striga asiatica TaxID=4170 RepID=A0A5A7QZ36_STRAF|nr:hypothetical protein STAS_26933 [Striga asiatica]
MAFSMPRFFTFPAIYPPTSKLPSIFRQSFVSYPTSSKINSSFGCRYTLLCCYAAAKQQKSGGAPPAKKKKQKKSSSRKNNIEEDYEIQKSVSGGGRGGAVEVRESPSRSELPMPNPPAGFVFDEHGNVLMASNKRITTIVDSTNNLPLDCVIRRVFKNSRGDECMLLCPVDAPVEIMKSVNVEGWSAVSDQELEAILPTASYALAKIHMHLVCSGFCFTARGGFCYSENAIFEYQMDNREDGLPAEGVEITCFNVDGSHYMIYTPADPLLFVAVKDENGVLQIADDELLEDPAVISAIDEETEFNALVEEETALLDSVMGNI